MVIGPDYGAKELALCQKNFTERAIQKGLTEYLTQLHNKDPEIIRNEPQRLAKSIYQKHLAPFCSMQFKHNMPMLEEPQGLLIQEEEESKVYALLSKILGCQGRRPTLAEVWVLEKKLEKEMFREDLLKRVFPDYFTNNK